MTAVVPPPVRPSVADDEAFLQAFADTSLPPEAFGHRAHVRMAWLYLKRVPRDEVLTCFCHDLHAYASVHGDPGRFSASLTCADLLVIHRRMAGGTAEEAFEGFLGRNRDLLEDGTATLGREVPPGTLGAALADADFVLPTGVSSDGSDDP